jgi:hypothetical protein
MNERIKELAEQAGIEVWGGARYVYHPSEILNSTVVTKFAELIVAECAEVLDETISPPSHPMNSIGYRLKKHFGVES